MPSLRRLRKDLEGAAIIALLSLLLSLLSRDMVVAGSPFEVESGVKDTFQRI